MSDGACLRDSAAMRREPYRRAVLAVLAADSDRDRRVATRKRQSS
jgi:hypothetical protein